MRESWPPYCLIVIPCLNEAAHIGALLEHFRPAARRLDARIVVVDGGSRDGTAEIVQRMALEDPNILYMYNKARLQSAAVNLAVDLLGDGVEYLIRIDAHGDYPDDYCDRLIEEAKATGADSVVVSMQTRGSGIVQRAVAAVQNSRLGTGGSKHRLGAEGQWIDHGHHALMRIPSFRAVGGYDETFSHNEDAELDHRLRQAGGRIWLTARTRMTYFPRSTFRGLYLQYLDYGRGRARNVLKHRVVPKVRQLVPLLILPVSAFALLSFVHWAAALPFMAWLSVCLAYAAWLAVRERDAQLLLAGPSAMVMHFAWSLGFWQQLLLAGLKKGVA